MKELMQNHPLFRDFPVKGYKVVWQIYQNNQLQGVIRLLHPLMAIIGIIVVIATAIGIGISCLIFVGIDSLDNVSGRLNIFFSLWASTAVGIVIIIMMAQWILRAPVREQQRYYHQGNLTQLDERKRLALRLDIVATYGYGFWIETLEHYPLTARLKQPAETFPLLEPSSPQAHREGLYDDWGIVDIDGYQSIVEKLWAGMHSRHFFVNMHQENNGSMVTTLAALIELPKDYIQSCAISGKDGRPPALVWAFDLWRVIKLSRNCFCAGIISERLAWDNILKTADMIYELFDSFDSYYNNYRLGHAFWSNDYSMIKDRLEQYNNYKAHCDWPITLLPWPTPPGISLSDDMRHGFMKSSDLAFSSSVINKTVIM
ncbi:DUF1266 domain-containing protein [Pragia fontium]|nr:DUF1266 domain-containing protein [Pragia fontium]